MKKALVTIEMVLATDDEVCDPDTYFREAAESVLGGIPEDWWRVTEESLHIESVESIRVFEL